MSVKSNMFMAFASKRRAHASRLRARQMYIALNGLAAPQKGVKHSRARLSAFVSVHPHLSRTFTCVAARAAVGVPPGPKIRRLRRAFTTNRRGASPTK
jgi:hypothetical protein